MRASHYLASFAALASATPLLAQIQVGDPRMNDPARSLREPHIGGSSNIKVMSHIPLGGWSQVMDVEIEQELSRPYVYVSRADFLPLMGQQAPDGSQSKGVDIISIKDPAHAKLLYSWRIENQELHQPLGGMDNGYFKLKGRYYDVQSLQFLQGGPDIDVGAVVLDVTGLPDTATIREAGRIRAPATPGGFHNALPYKHSSGRVLLFTTTSGNSVNVYDMEKFLAKDSAQGLIAKVPNPDSTGMFKGYHDFYLGYDPANHRDVFYGAGYNGYYIFDVTDPTSAKLLTSITGTSGMFIAHTITPGLIVASDRRSGFWAFAPTNGAVAHLATPPCNLGPCGTQTVTRSFPCGPTEDQCGA